APAETEGTIRLVGSGGFCLLGERVSEPTPEYLPGTIPLDDPNLSEAFVRSVYAFFDLPIEQEPLSVGNDP
ncbi:hypothetical protein IH601_07640, partial [Candidatus Bipolaricaulota bacterium]|nr:hypothetical protein [Candidatus Bipolaricaulota bacterium]